MSSPVEPHPFAPMVPVATADGQADAIRSSLPAVNGQAPQLLESKDELASALRQADKSQACDPALASDKASPSSQSAPCNAVYTSTSLANSASHLQSKISISNLGTPFMPATKSVIASLALHEQAALLNGGDMAGGPGSIRTTPSDYPVTDEDDTSARSSAATGSDRTARGRWDSAVRAVSSMSAVARQFHTLRDMQTADFEISRQAIKVLGVIGKGAFAIVEKCVYQPSGGQPVVVAVKRLKPNLTRNEADIRDMVQEVSLLRKLGNRHIVSFLGYGYWEFSTGATQQGSLFLVEEYMDAGTLKQLVVKSMKEPKKGFYRTLDALRWLKQTALGLAYLHRSQPQVIHRDLKLDNILLKGASHSVMEAKIADFGLSALVRRTSAYEAREKEMLHSPKVPLRARRASATDLDAVWATAAETRALCKVPTDKDRDRSKGGSQGPVPGQLHVASAHDQLSGRTGTLMYMAPEVYRQEKYNEKADVFSYAIIAYELLHRYVMISATDGSLAECQAYARRVARGFRPPCTSKLPRPLAELLHHCWHQDPAQRPSMEDIASRISDIETHFKSELAHYDTYFGGPAVGSQEGEGGLSVAPGKMSNVAQDAGCCVVS